jgi:hypothetical protein
VYGCETWSLILREEHRSKVFENRALRRVFGSERGKVEGGWRRLHNEDLHYWYSSPNIIKVIKSGRLRRVVYVARMGKMRNAYKIFVGKPEWKRPVGRSSRTWNNNIRMGLSRSRFEGRGLDASDSGLGPVAGCCEHGNEHSGSIKGGKFLD